MRVLRASLVAVLTVAVCVTVAAAGRGGERPAQARTTPWPHPAPRYTVPLGFDGINEAIAAEQDRRASRWYAWAADQDRQRAAAAAEARARSASASASRGASTRPAITGSCAAMAPPGWMGANVDHGLSGAGVIGRESRGDPTALNPSGAYGCAQLMPGTGGTGTYAERWARAWAGGAGACNWQPPNYCAD